MNNLADIYKNINKHNNVEREYKILKYDIALSFRDFFVKFKLLNEDLALSKRKLIDNLYKKLSPRLKILV